MFGLIPIIFTISPILLVTVKGNGNYSIQQQDSSDGEKDKSFGDISPLSSATEAVDNFLAKFEAFSGPTDDIGALLEQISLNSSALIKLALPVGSLIASGLQINKKPKSEEYEALEKLDERMEANFKEMEKARIALNWIGMFWKFGDYSDKITLPAISLREMMSMFWNPKFEKNAREVEKFSDICHFYSFDYISPARLLNYISYYTFKYCRKGLSPEKISLLAQFVPMLRKIRLKMSFKMAIEQFDNIASKLIVWFTYLESEKAQKVLRKMEKSLVNLPTFFWAHEALGQVKGFLFESFPYEPSASSYCMLGDIIIGTNYQRKPIEAVQNQIRMDVLQFMVFGTLCMNVSFGYSLSIEELNFRLNHLKKTAEEILDNTRLFVSDELEKSFPHIEIGVVKSKIDKLRSQQPITDSLTIAAAKFEIFDELNKIGNRKYSRRGFVSTNLQNETNFVARCSAENDCFILADYEELHVMVTRFDMEKDEKRAKKANEWLYSSEEEEEEAAVDEPQLQQQKTKTDNISRAEILREFIERNYNADKVLRC